MYLESDEQVGTHGRAPNGDTIDDQVRSDLVLDQRTGEKLLAALDDQIAMTDSALARAREAAISAPFGDNAVARAMAEKFRLRADGGPRSLVAILDSYRASLADARHTAAEAMRQYAAAEQDRAAQFDRIS